MNRFERRPLSAGEAEVEYLDGEYRILRPGGYVRCAVTGVPIKLEDLRYWNVDLQEPYAGPEAKLQRLGITGSAAPGTDLRQRNDQKAGPPPLGQSVEQPSLGRDTALAEE